MIVAWRQSGRHATSLCRFGPAGENTMSIEMWEPDEPEMVEETSDLGLILSLLFALLSLVIAAVVVIDFMTH
jgi:hypothetical protein